jgi:hypothetical protein
MAFVCPQTLDEVTEQTLKLLPRGRAWQTNEGLPPRGMEAAFNPEAFNNDAFSTQDRTGSVLWQYWRSFAVMMYFFYVRLCALREEFWCHSINETRDEWMIEYGLPDPCDPFPDLCTKVTALGGTRCEFYAEIAARGGWTIDCQETYSRCGGRAGCSFAGNYRAGSTIGRAELRIIVYLDQSPSWQEEGRFLPSLAGRMRAGRRLSCGPDLFPLQCLLSRVVHAEILTIYEVRNGS